MRVLVERAIDADGHVLPGKARGRGRSVSVNLAESPLSWLGARGLLDVRQIAAGERLRADYERAAIGPAVTMRWSARVDGGAGPGLEPGAAHLAAKRRFDAAVTAVGRGLNDVLWRVVCAGEGLPTVEKSLGWPTRSGRLVLTMALDRLADHYGLG
ncbi:DUF6456 domain-containing protein [Sphingomonas mucosissima]|uniref:DUF6456 domain-containing protein n=1 Tax=Sphingomonas mucosissima TaxID=370959 RepID=A0A245ZIN1_9SPHN|nr:DUF6456 domain-containing protein [Sphingomonas mucosissima]OWK29601.1 hypothetical protein SPMU_20210 [Sphingomonas mucosissima]